MRKILLATTALIATAPAYAWDKGICTEGWCTYTITNQMKYDDPNHNEIDWLKITDKSAHPPTVYKFIMKLEYGESTTFKIPEKGGCFRDLEIYLHRIPGQSGHGPLSNVFDTTVVANVSHAPGRFNVCSMHEIIMTGDTRISYK